MPTLLDCKFLIESIRASAADPESAYALRTRLGRTILAAGHIAAKRAGLSLPSVPSDIVGLTSQDQLSQEILLSCNRLASLSSALCQPSEALDSRWKRGWSRLLPELRTLELALLELDRQST